MRSIRLWFNFGSHTTMQKCIVWFFYENLLINKHIQLVNQFFAFKINQYFAPYRISIKVLFLFVHFFPQPSENCGGQKHSMLKSGKLNIQDGGENSEWLCITQIGNLQYPFPGFISYTWNYKYNFVFKYFHPGNS